MKKLNKSKLIFSVAAFMAMVNVYSADVSGRVFMKGNLAAQSKNTDGKDVYSVLQNNKVNQKDDDGLEFEVDGGIAGAHIAMWYQTETQTEEDDWKAFFRRTYLWFKPVDAVKVQVGYSGNDTFFKEKVDEWKVGSPFALLERDWTKHPVYVNCSDVEGWGFAVEAIPMDGLVLNAACAPKGDNPEAQFGPGVEESTYNPWGAGVKYYWGGYAFQASYRDNGKDSWKVARFGAGYDANNLFAFAQPIFGIDYNSEKDKYEVNGICFDLYGQYSMDSLTFILHAPVTVRTSGDDNDCNYMEFCSQVKYNLGAFGNLDDVTPYLTVRSVPTDDETIKYRAWMLDDNFGDSFNVTVAPGVEFKVGSCELDVAFNMNFYSKYEQDHGDLNGAKSLWSVPFSAEIKF